MAEVPRGGASWLLCSLPYQLQAHEYEHRFVWLTVARR